MRGRTTGQYASGGSTMRFQNVPKGSGQYGTVGHYLFKIIQLANGSQSVTLLQRVIHHRWLTSSVRHAHGGYALRFY